MQLQIILENVVSHLRALPHCCQDQDREMEAGWEEVPGSAKVSEPREQHLCADLTFIAQHKLMYSLSDNKVVVGHQGINGGLNALSG